jgi:hypothetical protein
MGVCGISLLGLRREPGFDKPRFRLISFVIVRCRNRIQQAGPGLLYEYQAMRLKGMEDTPMQLLWKRRCSHRCQHHMTSLSPLAIYKSLSPSHFITICE